MDFLQVEGKTFVIFGVANRKSVAWHIGKTLEESGATVVYVVRSPERRDSLLKLMGDRPLYVCDVEFEDQIAAVREQIGQTFPQLDGLVHSIAFADYEGGIKPFHETGKKQFMRTIDISCYSFMAVANQFKTLLSHDASVVTISISTTTMASENYGFMAPVKAALDSSLAFLAKSFSQFSNIRFNAVAPGLLKTSASAGIPGYVDAYLFAEKVIPRGAAVTTQEAANAACFLLSPRSSGMNAQRMVIDAGMAINYFDSEVVSKVMSDPD
ncbi:MAG: SDR family oxidoreductase [Mariniblastus sp.]|nr:SDR family oxidoreductase [Mariniblastus sp.]